MPTEKTGRVNPSTPPPPPPVSAQDFADALFELEGSAEHKAIMLYGDSGTGKTVLAGSVPGRVLWLAGEPGYISNVRRGGRGTGRLIPDTATALAACAWMEDGNASKFDWLVVDGVSTMDTKFRLGYAAEAFDRNPASRTHRNLPDKPDYFNAQNFMKSWVARLIDLPLNVIFTAHVMRTEDSDGDLLVMPGIQGKGGEVSNYVSGLMHCVGYCDIRIRKTEDGPQEAWSVLWRETRDPKTDVKYFAKDQFDCLPRFMDNTNMTEVLKIIDNSGNGSGEVESAPQKPTKRGGARRA